MIEYLLLELLIYYQHSLYLAFKCSWLKYALFFRMFNKRKTNRLTLHLHWATVLVIRACVALRGSTNVTCKRFINMSILYNRNILKRITHSSSSCYRTFTHLKTRERHNLIVHKRLSISIEIRLCIFWLYISLFSLACYFTVPIIINIAAVMYPFPCCCILNLVKGVSRLLRFNLKLLTAISVKVPWRNFGGHPPVVNDQAYVGATSVADRKSVGWESEW